MVQGRDAEEGEEKEDEEEDEGVVEEGEEEDGEETDALITGDDGDAEEEDEEDAEDSRLLSALREYSIATESARQSLASCSRLAGTTWLIACTRSPIWSPASYAGVPDDTLAMVIGGPMLIPKPSLPVGFFRRSSAVHVRMLVHTVAIFTVF